MEMIKSRNLTSHTYNEDTAKLITTNIIELYVPRFIELSEKNEKSHLMIPIDVCGLDEKTQTLLPCKIDLSLKHHIDNDELIEHIERVGKLFYVAANHPD